MVACACDTFVTSLLNRSITLKRLYVFVPCLDQPVSIDDPENPKGLDLPNVAAVDSKPNDSPLNGVQIKSQPEHDKQPEMPVESDLAEHEPAVELKEPPKSSKAENPDKPLVVNDENRDNQNQLRENKGLIDADNSPAPPKESDDPTESPPQPLNEVKEDKSVEPKPESPTSAPLLPVKEWCALFEP